jgi:hypothetical protein
MGAGDDFAEGWGGWDKDSKARRLPLLGSLIPSRRALVLGHRVNSIFYLLHERRCKLCVQPVGAVPDPEVFTTPSGTGSLSTPM